VHRGTLICPHGAASDPGPSKVRQIRKVTTQWVTRSHDLIKSHLNPYYIIYGISYQARVHLGCRGGADAEEYGDVGVV
jgi:hypothetical protein